MRIHRSGLALMVMLLIGILAVLMCGDFLRANILFSNDGPLGRLMSQCHRLPDRFTGCWEDLNLLGARDWGTAPSLSYGLLWLLKPFWFAKLYAPVALVLLGLGAWCCFRQWGLAPAACVLGGLAAALNSSFFSVACWGVASHTIGAAMVFFTLALLADTSSRWRWVRVVLAGLAVGMGVAEAADVGALFSLLVAAFLVYQAWQSEGSRVKNLAAGLGRLAVIALCAACLAAEAISGLVSTEIKGVAGTQPDAQTKEEHWEWATQWSLPKREALSLIVPGLFGYRMDTPNGGEYWGGVGRSADWSSYLADGSEGPLPHGLLRFSGGGSYVGVLVLLLAAWAGVQSMLGKNSVFSAPQRKVLWFWRGVGFISLLLAFGRYAPFYRLIYALPYFSTIRNPVKFLDVLAFCLVILFAFGVDGLWRRYMVPAAVPWPGLKNWWARAGVFERRWTQGCALVLGGSLVTWLFYASSRKVLEQYLQMVQFDAARAHAISGFSLIEVGWFVLFFGLAAGLMAVIFSGAFSGVRAPWGGVVLGLALVADLGRANLPWVVYWNADEMYASNPIVNKLREQPFEHRVAMLPFPAPPEVSFFGQLYEGQWLKHLFPYYNIQALEPIQMPREPVDVEAYQKALTTTNVADFLRVTLRAWQLTNTRYLLGAAGFYSALARISDPAHPAVRIVERFTIVPRPGITTATDLEDLTVTPDPEGLYALFEFTGALPRAKLYTDWLVRPNDQAVLDQLAGTTFDPERTAFVAGEVPPAPAATSGAPHAGTVEFASYSPKDIVLRAKAAAPSVLLLNDRFDPNWRVWVDGRPKTLLRCNYIMRGVYLVPGVHSVEFRFQPPLGPFYISVSAIGVGLLLLGFVLAVEWRRVSLAPLPAPAQQPVPPRPHLEPAPGRSMGKGSHASLPSVAQGRQPAR